MIFEHGFLIASLIQNCGLGRKKPQSKMSREMFLDDFELNLRV